MISYLEKMWAVKKPLTHWANGACLKEFASSVLCFVFRKHIYFPMFFMQKNVYLTLNKDELILDLELLYFAVLQYTMNYFMPQI